MIFIYCAAPGMALFGLLVAWVLKSTCSTRIRRATVAAANLTSDVLALMDKGEVKRIRSVLWSHDDSFSHEIEGALDAIESGRNPSKAVPNLRLDSAGYPGPGAPHFFLQLLAGLLSAGAVLVLLGFGPMLVGPTHTPVELGLVLAVLIPCLAAPALAFVSLRGVNRETQAARMEQVQLLRQAVAALGRVAKR